MNHYSLHILYVINTIYFPLKSEKLANYGKTDKENLRFVTAHQI